MKVAGFFALCLGLFCGAPAGAAGFDMVVLGARGGIEDGNLSAYLVRPIGDDRAVLCDAGTIVHGINEGVASGAFADLAIPPTSEKAGYILHHVIRAYLVSHAHFDHIAGLIAVSPDDNAKPIYALASVNDVLMRHVFNWEVWPNMGDRGRTPLLATYHYQDMAPGAEIALAGTAMRAQAFPLSHAGVESTAFLIRNDDDALLYLGDTGPDKIEHSTYLHDLWRMVAPLVRAHHLRGIVIECSYDMTRDDAKLFGHLSPRWLEHELEDLRAQAGSVGALSGLRVVVSHIKYDLASTGTVQARIGATLRARNATGVDFIIAEQGARIRFE